MAPTDARVLITGENGSGKNSWRDGFTKKQRANAPIVEVNCAYRRTDRKQLFDMRKALLLQPSGNGLASLRRHGGTLFLDEIGDMSLNAQAKVLRALQEGKIAGLGAIKKSR